MKELQKLQNTRYFLVQMSTLHLQKFLFLLTIRLRSTLVNEYSSCLSLDRFLYIINSHFLTVIASLVTKSHRDLEIESFNNLRPCVFISLRCSSFNPASSGLVNGHYFPFFLVVKLCRIQLCPHFHCHIEGPFVLKFIFSGTLTMKE